MTGIVDWAASRARMVLAFIILSLAVGGYAYVGLPKEGEPDIEIPALFVSVPFPGISAEDSETLLVKPMEVELADLDGLKNLSATASEGYAGIGLEFEFGWDKTKTMADVRDAMNAAQGKFPDGAENYSVNEINFSEFPIIIVNLTGNLPERTMNRIATDMQEEIEAMDSVLEAGIAGKRGEMIEVLIDPLRLESYNVTANELINVVRNNNQLIAAGEIETNQGKFAVKIPSSFDDPRDIYSLPVKRNGDRVVTLGDLAEIRLAFEDSVGTARFNGETTVALQVVKRRGFNLIGTAEEVKLKVEEIASAWPDELVAAVTVGTSNDQSVVVGSMVSQLEGSVLTAIALVMIVVLAALGPRPALLVGFAIPTSFLLCFALLAMLGVTISNIVMFGLILAVGMLVDGAIVVVEYADRRISEGVGPMHAYVDAAKRMFWPIVSSTATTLCAFLPMLFWPGVPGQFMGMLPVTLIFVLSASLVVALVYLPVMGGVTGRLTRVFGDISEKLRASVPWVIRAAMVPVSAFALFASMMQTLNPTYLFGDGLSFMGPLDWLPGMILFMLSSFLASIFMTSAKPPAREKVRQQGGLTLFGRLIKLISGNPIMPLVTIGSVGAFVVFTFATFGENNKGVEFFVESEPEQAIVYVLARGNLSLEEKDVLVSRAEQVVLEHPGIATAFAFAGQGGLSSNTGGASVPLDTIGQIQLETVPWADRPTISVPWFKLPILGTQINRTIKDPAWDGDLVLDQLTESLEQLPGTRIEILSASRGPASGKPVSLRLKSDNWDDLVAATTLAREKFENTAGLNLIEDTLPLPGIDWQIDVDVEKAGRYGADVATVGGMVQLVTRGILLDTMRVDSSDEEVEIRVRLPEEDRVLSTLDNLKVRTQDGLVPLANFITRKPVAKLAEINRIDQKRYFEVKAGVATGLMTDDGTNITANERIQLLTDWLDTKPFPVGVSWEWTGDQAEQEESQAFLMSAFAGALGLMFIILLAQFNSFYNSVLVLLAVVLSTAGVLWGMIIREQAFSIIMTGTGIVALAGIVVNNNIVLIDTYQEYSKYMSRLDAIVRTAQARIRPVLLTTITTMAGLAPMMFGLSLDFFNGGYSFDSPTALWWKQLATAIVFGLGIATVLTLVFTPAMLALRVWAGTYVLWILRLLARLSLGRGSRLAKDLILERAASRAKSPTILWDTEVDTGPSTTAAVPLRAAE
jgi:multidrug efflux pump